MQYINGRGCDLFISSQSSLLLRGLRGAIFPRTISGKAMNSFSPINLQHTDDPFDHGMHEVIDVRTPVEYQNDHIPGALNLPVLSNEERHVIGKEYHYNSFEAKRHGASVISKNISKFIDSYFADKPRHKSFLIYCWRGGQRSKSLSLVLNMIGYDVKYLHGGYKNYRRLIVTGLSYEASRLSYNVISGMTGTGKTWLMKILAETGEQVLDLESLANHKGSVLGTNYENREQPSTRLFETALYNKLAAFDSSKPVWVEAEGRKIGAIQIPDSVFSHISNNIINYYTLQASMESRVDYIMRDYEFLRKNPDLLKRELARLQKFHLPLKKWYKLIDEGELEQFVCEILTCHYDPQYRKSQPRNIARYVPHHRKTDIKVLSIDEESLCQSMHCLMEHRDLCFGH